MKTNITHTNILFSVIICCYNSEKYLKETINSIILQTHKRWEIIIINDGSTDSTENIIFDYIKLGVPIIYEKQENLGFASARNKALSIANSEWVAIVDHDDICLPKRLEIQAKQITDNPNSKLFFGDALLFDSKNNKNINHFSKFNMNKIKIKNNKDFHTSLIIDGCFIVSSTVVFNKTAAIEIGKFKEKLITLADYDFFISLSKKYLFTYSKEIISKMRIHSMQSSVTNQKKYFNELNTLLSFFLLQKHFNFFEKLFIFKRIFLFKISFFLKNLLKN